VLNTVVSHRNNLNFENMVNEGHRGEECNYLWYKMNYPDI
jgi:hypothetical protein